MTTTHDDTGKRWSKNDDGALIEELKRGSIHDAASRLQRTIDEVRQRLAFLTKKHTTEYPERSGADDN